MKNKIRRVAAALLAAVMVLTGVMCDFTGVTAYAAGTLTGKTAEQITKAMGFGWNLGNSFDATGGNSSDIYSQEQSWGNPIVTKSLIKAVKDAGFSTIRIPVTWYNHISSDGTYTIDPAFLARVKTVVDYAYTYNLYVILNIHHEEWVNTASLATNYVQIGTELNAVWEQIADYFAGYDQHLIFEGMNEPRMAGASNEWTGNTKAYAAVNYLNQIFVSTVRASKKGYNDERCLMIPAYAASSSYSILNALSIPTVDGEACNNIIISVHSYEPYNFCLSDDKTTFSASSSSDTAAIDTVFKTIDELFLSKGIPVVIGESSATNSGNNTSARAAWAGYMGKQAAGYGVPVILWDNGYNGTSGGECHSYINRKTGAVVYPTIISSLMNAKKNTAWGSLRSETSAVKSIVGGSVIWSSSKGLTSTSTYDSSYIVMSASESWFSSGRSIAVVYTGSGTPQLVLDSAEVSAWWIPVAPTSTATVSGKKVAYFDFDAIRTAYKQNGVTKPSQLRNMSVIATGSNITTYEVSVTGAFTASYMLNGAVYAQGTSLPAAPSVTNMKFEGWYSTRDYQSGTVYTGGTLTSDLTLYPKFSLKLDLTPEGYLPFTDVFVGTWKYSTAKYVYNRGVILGTTDETFSPDSSMSRGQFITILWRLEGSPAVSDKKSFPDVAADKYYSTAIAWAKAKGLASGYEDGTFGAANPISRQQFMVFMQRYAKYKGFDISTASAAYKECTDYKQVASYAVSAIAWGYEKGFIGANKVLDSQSSITRAEAAAIFQRFLQYYGI